MVVNNYAKNQISLFIGGSNTEYIDTFVIGTGSGVATVSQNELISVSDAQSITSVNYPSAAKVKWQADWNSVEMSGIQLKEFGTKSGTGLTGSIWSRTSIPSLNFDGTNELRIEETWEVF